MDQENTRKQKRIYGLLILSLVFLFNPSISVIDILPDFISYFILARIFLYASDCAPHFEEARINFKRLGWINFLKCFGLLLMVMVKRVNVTDNDIIPLVTLTFAVIEAFIACLAIKNIFDALFYLGNRSDAVSTISSVKLFGMTVSAEGVRYASFFFVISKCVIYFLPTPFLLTSTSLGAGGRLSLAKSFTATLVASHLIGILIGVAWLILMVRYTNMIKNEGKFFPTLTKLLSLNRGFNLENKNKIRSISTSFTIFTVASLFTLELSLVESYDVNLLPHFIYAAIMLYAVYSIKKYASGAALATAFGWVYFAFSAVAYYFETAFLTEYGYERLITNSAAREAYIPVKITAIAEFSALLVFLFFVAKLLHSFIIKNTGINEHSSNLKSNEGYYGALIKKNIFLFIAGVTAGAVKLASTIIHGAVKVIFSNPEDVTQPVVIAPRVEWIGLLVSCAAILYIGVTIYFFSTLKDEVKLKYED